MFFGMIYKSGQIFLPFCYNTRVWQTDRQTDRRTDGQTEFSSQYRVCITCSAVKSWLEDGAAWDLAGHQRYVRRVPVEPHKLRTTPSETGLDPVQCWSTKAVGTPQPLKQNTVIDRIKSGAKERDGLRSVT